VANGGWAKPGGRSGTLFKGDGPDALSGASAGARPRRRTPPLAQGAGQGRPSTERMPAREGRSVSAARTGPDAGRGQGLGEHRYLPAPGPFSRWPGRPWLDWKNCRVAAPRRLEGTNIPGSWDINGPRGGGSAFEAVCFASAAERQTGPTLALLDELTGRART